MTTPPDDEDTFLRALVKGSRQRTIHVPWKDRDGTARLTTLTAAESARLNALARARKVSPGELLRQAAHLPVLTASPAPSHEE
jgi:hypothetical protein